MGVSFVVRLWQEDQIFRAEVGVCCFCMIHVVHQGAAVCKKKKKKLNWCEHYVVHGAASSEASFTQDAEHLATCAFKLWNTLQ